MLKNRFLCFAGAAIALGGFGACAEAPPLTAEELNAQLGCVMEFAGPGAAPTSTKSNGREVHVGDVLDGARIIRIDANPPRIIFERGGQAVIKTCARGDLDVAPATSPAK